ncbi:hypothetical protein ACFYE3_00745 [Kocuria sp. CPCC 205293]
MRCPLSAEARSRPPAVLAAWSDSSPCSWTTGGPAPVTS